MKNLIILIFFGFIMTSSVKAQENRFSQDLYNTYEQYREHSIKHRRIKRSDIDSLIDKLKEKGFFSVRTLGHSAEGREINMVTAGKGKTKVLLWSQMHGDESTATMALFDIFNFLSASGDSFDPVRREILNKTTLYFIPMLNPDGAERFQRRNALEIDINRDASMLVSPESVILKNTRDSLQADFGFNLHDQSTRHSVGRSFRSATLSFLAPPVNYERTVNDVRERAMKLIANMYNELSLFIPGHMAKYPDDFEPRAFGDNIQRWGTSTILIESGGWHTDHEKQFTRKMNYTGLLSSMLSIATGSYKSRQIEEYYKIPDNADFIFDLLLRNLTLKTKDLSYRADLGINRMEVSSGGSSLYFHSLIEDMGDLSTYFGFEEFDCSSMEAFPGKVHPIIYKDMDEVRKLNFPELLKEGFTSVKVRREALHGKHSPVPLNLIAVDENGKTGYKESEFKPGAMADLVIYEGPQARFAVVNGFIYDLKTMSNNVFNGLILQ
ncbi:MAG TPA: M14 metallopeptidase family protein [Ignavibacteriales bacterium]|nr:M14 metallopeptidase family protein [Ignavibacteriales bacterium]